MRLYLAKGGESVSAGCSLFEKSRQAYYKSQKAKRVKLERTADVISLVDSIRLQMPSMGTRKIHYILGDKPEFKGVGRDKLFTIVKANQRLIVPKRSYKITTNSHHRFRKHKDIVTDLTINRPEQVWVSDITYISNRGNHQYLALVADAYSKKIMGSDLSNSLSTDGSLRALKMAFRNRIYAEPLIHHSDRGLQYCSDMYQKKLRKKKIIVSMTGKYDPYANAIAERVNGILKQEFLLEEYKYSVNILKIIVKESIVVYNRKRPHLSCQMLTPEQMHLQLNIARRTYGRNTKSANGVIQYFV